MNLITIVVPQLITNTPATGLGTGWSKHLGYIAMGIKKLRWMQPWQRIMDAVDPEITQLVERRPVSISGVMDVHDVAIRWVGHRLRAELHIIVNCALLTRESHEIAEQVRHALFHDLPALVDVIVHVDPCECAEYTAHHQHTRHHEPGV